MRLKPGDKIPSFMTQDIEDQRVDSFDFKGRFTLLSFYRFAACPFCNIRIHALEKQKKWFERLNVKPVGVFHSPQERLTRYLAGAGKKLWFPIIPDPEKKLYGLYRIENSVMGTMVGMAKNMGVVASFMKPGEDRQVEGGMTGMPADFLIGPDLTVLAVHYGSHLADHMALEQIERAVGLATGQPLQKAQ